MSSRIASFHEVGVAGALLAPLKWLCVTVFVLLGLLVAAWIIDLSFVLHVWPEGQMKLEGILAQDMARIERLGGDPFWPGLARRSASFFYALLFKLTGVHDMGLRFAIQEPLSIPDTITRDAYIAHYEVIQVAMIGTQLFGVRIVMLAMALPVFGLVYTVSFADGLTQRAIRRASGGHESSTLYHRAKYLQLGLGVLVAASILLAPVSTDPQRISVFAALLLAVLTRLQWTYYKKHL